MEGFVVATHAEVLLSEADEQALAHILGCPLEALPEHLAVYANAALREYAEMFLGRGVFTRGSDLLEFRLRLLTEHAFGNTIPDEARVSRLFQTSAQASRGMIRALVSKYQYQLQAAVSASVQAILGAAQQSEAGGDYTVTINSHNLVEILNQRLALRDGTQRPVRRQKDSVSTYEIAPASYALLLEEFGL